MAKKKTAAKRRSARKPARAPDLDYIAEDLRPLAVPIGKLKPDPDNARTHGRQNLVSIARSLRTYGQLKPVVANRLDGRLLAGNGTYLQARQMGWSHLAVVWAELDETAARGFSIADNRTAELAGWDDGLLLQQIDLIGQEMPDLAAALQLAELKQSLDGAEEAKGDEDPRADEPLPEHYQVLIECADEEDQKATYEKLQAEGRQCRLLTL